MDYAHLIICRNSPSNSIIYIETIPKFKLLPVTWSITLVALSVQLLIIRVPSRVFASHSGNFIFFSKDRCTCLDKPQLRHNLSVTILAVEGFFDLYYRTCTFSSLNFNESVKPPTCHNRKHNASENSFITRRNLSFTSSLLVYTKLTLIL